MAGIRRPITWLRLVAVLLAGTAVLAAPGAVAGNATPAASGSHLTSASAHILGGVGRGLPHSTAGFLRAHRTTDAAASLPAAALILLVTFAFVAVRRDERVAVQRPRTSEARAPPADLL